MQQQVFPVLGDEKELPLYVIGIGVEYWQFPINRPSGYEFPQFLFTRRGAGKIVINGTEHELTKDSVCFIPAGCPHSYQAVSEPWVLNWVSFSGYESASLLEKWGLNHFAVHGGADRMQRIIGKAYYTIKNDKLYGNHYASVHLYDLLIEYRKLADNRQSELSSVNTAALADVLQYIEDNYFQQIKLSTLSDIAGITEQHLCRLFKRNFRMRPMEYLAKVRIQHAKEMLVFSDKSISEIAETVGFPDSSYFSAVFKKYEHIPPVEYRSKL